MTAFERIKTLECAPTDAVAVGSGLVAVCSGTQVTLVSETDQTSIDHGAPVTDVSIGERILVLSARQLNAYDRDGRQIWERSFDAPHAVTTLPSDGVVAVLEPGIIRTVEPGSGQTQGTIPREPEGRPDDDRFLGIEQGFVTSTWSLLQCVAREGTTLFEQNLNTAILDIGCVDETLVAALKNGHLKGFDLTNGEQQWQTELPVRQISPRGEGKLLLSTDSGVKSVTPDGAIDSVQGITNGRVYTDANSSIVCTEQGGTVAIHVPHGELLRIETVTDSVGIGGTIDIELTNRADSQRDLTIQGKLEHGDLSPSERQVTLGSQESSLVDFPVGGIRTDGEASFTAVIDDRVVEQHPIEVTDAAESALTAEASLSPVTVMDDAVTLELAVENTGSSPLDTVRILETDESVTDIDPGETWTTTLSKTYEPGRIVTVGVEIVRGNRRTEFAPTCEVPTEPAVELEQKGGALHATVTADDGVTWTDELVIEVPGADRVRSPVDITDGTLQVIIPAYESGIARVGLSKIGIAQQERITDRNPLSSLDSQTSTGTVAGASSETETRVNTGPGANRSRDRDQSTDRTSNRQSATDRQEASDWGTTDRDTGTAARTDADTKSAETSDSASGDHIVFERAVSDRSPPVGHVVTDSIRLRNRGNESIQPTVRLGQEEFDLELAPDATQSLERSVAVLTPDTTVGLPSATLRIEGAAVEELPPAELTPVRGGISVRGVVDGSTGTSELALENETASSRQITGIEMQGQRLLDGTVTIDAESTRELTGRFQPGEDDPVRCTIDFADGETITALLPVQADQVDNAGQSAGAPFECAIGTDTEVAGEYGTVVLEFRNDSGTTLTDVNLTAEGECINDMLYSPAVRDTLEPGGRIEHFVDLKTTAGEVSIELTASCTVGGESQSFLYRVAGPAVSTSEEWTDRHRTSWALETVEDEGQQSDVPDTVTTPYEQGRPESDGVGDWME